MTEQVNLGPRAGAVTPLGALELPPNASSKDVIASFDVASFNGRARLSRVYNTPDYTVQDSQEIRFTVTDWVVFLDERTDEKTGEVHTFTAMMFYDPEGRTLYTTGPVVRQRIAKFANWFTSEEWKAGITLMFRRRRTQDGHRDYHDVFVMPREDKQP